MDSRKSVEFREVFERIRNITKGRGIRLAERGRNGLFAVVFSRSGLIVLLLALQVLLLFALARWLHDYAVKYYIASWVLSAAVVLYMINSRMGASSKVTWLFLVLALPVFGVVFFLHTKLDIGHRRLKRLTDKAVRETMGALRQDPAAMAELELLGKGGAGLVRYMGRTGCYPVYRDEGTRYLPGGEEFLESLLEDLKKAESFIFLEFFIVEEGLMWGRILEVLAAKARVGVEVRVVYDGTCEFVRLPHGYCESLATLGIKAKVFSPIRPFVSTKHNYRDHRKIVVIDGAAAYTGGVNLADEYINAKSPYGRWKDAAVRVRGEAVASLTLMFLQSWFSDTGEVELGDYLQAGVSRVAPATGGFIAPFGDNPIDSEKVGENVYIDLVARANDHVYIMTPYLVLDGEMEQALAFAAGRGVDVRIVVPGVSDSFAAGSLALIHCGNLIEAGVRVFEWAPGFIHSKVCVSDAEMAVVGTINLDYRSLYLNLECACYLHRAACVDDIERDFQATFAECREVTRESLKGTSLARKASGALLRVFAPLI